MQSPKVHYFLVIVCLLLGAFIYFTSRPDYILLNEWLGAFGDGKVLAFLQGLFAITVLPDWLIYSVPNGLWMLGLVWIILLVWDFRIHTKSILWLVIAILSGIALETLQGFHLVRGTFDIIDLIFILLAAILPISITFVKQRLCATL